MSDLKEKDMNERKEHDTCDDVCSVLNKYKGILSLSGLEKITGIHQKQLWSYLKGNSKPRKKQVLKISESLNNLGRELLGIKLTDKKTDG